MKKSLEELYSGKYDILPEVPLNLLSIDCEPTNFRIDFVVCKGNRALVAIEVDGGYHREDETQMENDNRKDAIFSKLNNIELVRATTDGSEKCDILETIQAAVKKSLANSKDKITIDRKEYEKIMNAISAKSKLAAELQDKLRECLLAFEVEYEDAKTNGEDLKNIFPNYENDESIKNINYSDIRTVHYYLCRYGAAYAFEYAFMYSLVLLDKYQTNLKHKYPIVQPSILSLGCGSMINRWGMEYAIAMLSEDKNINCFSLNSYTGVDLVDWPVKVSSGDFVKCNITDVFGKDKTIHQNIISFPKILNELSRDTIDDLIVKIEETSFPEDEYYICFSHNLSGVINTTNPENKLHTSQRIFLAILNAIKNSTDDYSRKECFTTSDILNFKNNKNPGELKNLFAHDLSERIYSRFSKKYNNDFPSECYLFNESSDNSDYIHYFDKNFNITLDNGQPLDEYFINLSNKDENIRSIITHLDNIAFQIVKIRRLNSKF